MQEPLYEALPNTQHLLAWPPIPCLLFGSTFGVPFHLSFILLSDLQPSLRHFMFLVYICKFYLSTEWTVGFSRHVPSMYIQ